jgi:short-subunit dehydrogenase
MVLPWRPNLAQRLVRGVARGWIASLQLPSRKAGVHVAAVISLRTRNSFHRVKRSLSSNLFGRAESSTKPYSRTIARSRRSFHSRANRLQI